VITIDPLQPPSPLLSAAEMAKLTALQNTQEIFLFSAVSPDDSTIVMGSVAIGGATSEPAPPQAVFLNLADGTTEPIDPLFVMLSPQSTVVWRNAQTALYLARSETAEPLLVTLDRKSGGVQSAPLPVAGHPIGLAPNGAWVLVEVPTADGITLTAVNLATGASEALLRYPQGGGPSQVAWSADGSKLAFVRLTLDPGLGADQTHLLALATQDVLGKLPRSENPFLQGNAVAIFDLARHDFRPDALSATTEDDALFQQVQWSSDGQTLLVKMAHPSQPAGRQHPTTFYPDRAYYRFYDANLTLRETLDRPEIDAPLTTQALFVAPDEVVFVANAGITYRLYAYQRGNPLDVGKLRPLPLVEGSFAEGPQGYQVLVTHHSRQLVFVHSSFQRPPEVYRMELADGETQQLTRLNGAVAALNQIRVVSMTIPLPGHRVRTGYLLLPTDVPFPPHAQPMVLYQQGGPGGAMTNRWGATTEEPFALLPNFGIGVLFMPFAGREGFGPTFFNALVNQRNFGARDIDEAAQAVRYLVAQGYTMPAQVGITGCSYGGYFTSQSLVRHPTLYAAAHAQCSPLDLFQWWETVGRLPVSYTEGRLPTDDSAEYRRDSPFYRAARVHTPLLLFHGEADFLPVDTAKHFHDQLVAQGTRADLLIFQQEGHGLSHPTNKSVAAQWQIVWFRHHLSGAANVGMSFGN
jgi:dipeptidyl aminopeptidase/acylaminoacyl peptidase